MADFKTTIAPVQADGQLELDEIFTFYTMKLNRTRIWISLNKRNRQIVSFYLGDGSMNSCKKFYRKLPHEYYKNIALQTFGNPIVVFQNKILPKSERKLD